MKIFSGHIFLTGGTGFFGRSLLRFLQQADTRPETVCVLTRDPKAFLDRYPEFSQISWLSFAQGDVLKAETFPVDQYFTHVLHAATESTVGNALTPLTRYEQIVVGTKNSLDFAYKCRASRFLLTSSGGVYGPQPQDMCAIPETYCGMPDPLVPENAYSVAKRSAEHLCALYAQQYGLACVIARCFSFVGRDLPLDAHFAIGNFMRDALFAQHITVLGDGSPIRTYLDQRDLAAFLWGLLRDGKSGAAYNVGSDRGIALREVAFLVRDLIAPGKSVRILGEATSQYRNRYIPDMSKLARELNLVQRFSLEEAILEAKEGILSHVV